MLGENNVRVLIVEDELIVALNLSKELEAIGYVITGLAANESEAIQQARDSRPDVVLMDINLEDGGSGLTAAQEIHDAHQIPIIFVTAYSSDKIIELAGKSNPYGYILKPYNVREVKAVINTALVRFKYEGKIKESEQRLRFALEAADMNFMEFDHENQSVMLSLKAYPLEELGFNQLMSKQAFLERFVEKDAKILDELLAKGESFSKRARLVHDASENSKYLDVFLSQISLQNDKVQIGAIQDVSIQQQNIENLQVSDSVLNQMKESVLVLDAQERIIKTNPAFCRLVDVSNQEIINRPISDFLLHHRIDDKSIVKSSLEETNNQRLSEVTIKVRGGERIHAKLTVNILKTDDEREKYVITLTDISQLVEAERNLNKIAFTDSLTGFGNRPLMNQVLKRIEERRPSSSVALLFIDIDSFKNINDSLGHEFGDKVLIEFAKRLQSIFRDDDYLIRLGGDEFVVVLEGAFDEDALSHIAQKVMHLSDADFVINHQDLTVSCSLGIAYTHCRNFKAEALLKQADAAMYQAKKRGKNTFEFYDEKLANETQYRVFIEQGLKSAIRDEKIAMYLQPILGREGNITGVEALCRWYDKEIGFIPPSDFIPIAEESYLIHALGFKIINESMMAKRQLNEAGYKDIVVNINFSEKQLQDMNTYTVICELLSHYELHPEEFVIEITESTFHNSSSDKVINKLKSDGFKFAIDDFGTGYSSLSRLHDYAVDVVKIDKSFTDMVCTNTKQNVITAGIIDLSKKLGYKIVAEGVENEEQCKTLIDMGCDCMQGYYFAKPMAMQDLLKFLDQ